MTPTTVMTSSGAEIDLLRPRPEQIRVDDIVYSLSRKGRYNDHAARFYSVAQHCCHLADLMRPDRPDLRILALIHDAHEAYVGDLSRPFLRAISPSRVDEVKKRLDDAIYDAILGWRPTPADLAAIAAADDWLLHIEWRHMMYGPPPRPDCPIGSVASDRLQELADFLPLWTPPQSRREYLRRYAECQAQTGRGLID